MSRAPSISGTMDAGPFQLGYSVQGQGRPALVIGSATYYPRTFSQNLRNNLRMTFVDHRGFAKPTRDASPADYDLETVLADIERLRQQLDLRDVVVIGHSGHGYMALEYAKRYPESVSHVVMIGTGPSHAAGPMELAERHWQEAVCPARKERLAADLAHLTEEIAAAPDRRFVTFCLRMAARSWFDPAYDAEPLWHGVHVNMPVFDHLWGEAFRDIDITRGLRALDKPVLLALGRFDYLVAPPQAWDPYRASFHDLTIRVFDQSGHTPQLEESQAFDSELLRWLSR